MVHLSFLFKDILMQNSEKCHQNVWILSGTSDGPNIAERLLNLNYVVFVSVISYKASLVYPKKDKLHIITGRIIDEFEVLQFLEKHQIDLIIDSTHPFAMQISANLAKGCEKSNKMLIKFERQSQVKSSINSRFVDDLKGIKISDIKNKNLLLAVGARSLNEVAEYYIKKEVNIFARILATEDSILNAFSSCIRNSNIAILNPSKFGQNKLEYFLCKNWNIDYILCRDSGSYSQMIWEHLSEITNIKLFKLRRPIEKRIKYFFSDYGNLIKFISKI